MSTPASLIPVAFWSNWLSGLSANRPSQLCRSRPRVVSFLLLGSARRLAGDSLVHPGELSGAESAFHQAVLAAVKADDGNSSSGSQARRGHAQQLLQTGQLTIYED